MTILNSSYAALNDICDVLEILRSRVERREKIRQAQTGI